MNRRQDVMARDKKVPHGMSTLPPSTTASISSACAATHSFPAFFILEWQAQQAWRGRQAQAQDLQLVQVGEGRHGAIKVATMSCLP